MNKKQNKKQKLFNTKTITKILEKNPIKGGTPAIENNRIDIFKTMNEFWVNSLKVYSVFSFVVIKLNRDQKKDIKDKL